MEGVDESNGDWDVDGAVHDAGVTATGVTLESVEEDKGGGTGSARKIPKRGERRRKGYRGTSDGPCGWGKAEQKRVDATK